MFSPLTAKRYQFQGIVRGNYTRYKLYPYFGGDEVAPHDITIQMADLK